jgi:hypothetical protein
MMIWILLLVKVMRICYHWSTEQTIHDSILNLNAFIVSVHGPPWLHIKPLQLFNFDFEADPDPLQNADPDTASQNANPNTASQNADLDPQPCPKIHTKDSKYLEQYFKENKVDQFRALSFKRQNSRDFSCDSPKAQQPKFLF